MKPINQLRTVCFVVFILCSVGVTLLWAMPDPPDCGDPVCGDCSSGSVADPGTLSKSTDITCVGSSVTPPAFPEATFNDGSKNCYDDCDAWTDSVTYSQENWWEEGGVRLESFPSTFDECGVRTFTAKVKGVPDDPDCPGETDTVDVGTFTVRVVKVDDASATGADLVYTYGDSKLYTTCIGSGVVTVKATPCPSDTTEADLENLGCWTTSGGTGSAKLERTVTTEDSKTVIITFSAGGVTKTITVKVVKVSSLTPSPGTKVGDTTTGQNNVPTDIYIVPWQKPVAGTSGPFVNVSAASDPFVLPARLPSCWTLKKGPDEGNLVDVPHDPGETRKLALIDMTVPSSTLVVCKAGTSEKRVLVHVVQVEVQNAYTSQTLDPDILVDTEKVAIETKLHASITPSLGAPLTITYDWEIGGDKIKTYNHDVDEAGDHGAIALTTTALQDISYFWKAKGNPIAVIAKANIKGSAGGTGADVSATVNFNVKHAEEIQFGALVEDPNRLVYCADGAARSNPNGESPPKYPYYRVLLSHGNWHGPAGAGSATTMDNGETPASSAPSWGDWGVDPSQPSGFDPSPFDLHYNGSAFLLWHRAFIDAFLAWKSEFNVPGDVGVPPTYPPPAPSPDPLARPEYLKVNPTAGGAADRSRLYGYRRLGEFQDLNQLGRDVTHTWHNGGHVFLSGFDTSIGTFKSGAWYHDMFNFSSPRSEQLTFWRWHTVIDGVRSEWSKDTASVSSVVPADGAVLTSVPTSITITFSKKVSLRNESPNNTIGIDKTSFAFTVNGSAIPIPGGFDVSEDSTAGNRYTQFILNGLPTLAAGDDVTVTMTGTASFAGKSWSFTIAP